MNLGYLASALNYLPEIVSTIVMVFLLFIVAFSSDDESDQYVSNLAYFGLLAVIVLLSGNLGKPVAHLFSGAVVLDSYGTFAKVILVLGTIGAIHIARESSEIRKELRNEFTIMTIGIMIGGMLLISANNFLSLYLGVETLSILSYALAAMNKNDERSSEAGLKYVLYGGLSAGVMLFGMAHIFGVFGTIDFSEIGPKISSLSTLQIVVLLPSFLFFFVGLAYKVAAVPFHMWSPDVYEGAPTPVTTFFAIVPKIAALIAFMRITALFFSYPGPLAYAWGGLITVIAALTMTVGNISAINQRSVKRMLAYSSISHSGFMLAAILNVSEIGERALLFYIVTYLFMTLVAFYITAHVTDMYGNDHFERFSGLMKRYPLMSILMSISMLSLAGIPPLAGFVAKFNILSALVSKGNFTLAVVAVLNSVVSLYYYLKIVRIMVFKEAESYEPITGFSLKNQAVICVVALPVVVLGIFWNELVVAAGNAVLYVAR